MRLFVAIDLAPVIRSELEVLQASLQAYQDQLKIVPTQNLHLTLQFLGDCEQQMLTQIRAALNVVCKATPVFKLELAKTGCFPSPHKARVLWVSFQDQREALQSCVEMCQQELSLLGFEPEKRAFSAHVTLARVADHVDAQEIAQQYINLKPKPLQQEVPALALYQSVLKPAGAQYTCLFRTELSK